MLNNHQTLGYEQSRIDVLEVLKHSQYMLYDQIYSELLKKENSPWKTEFFLTESGISFQSGISLWKIVNELIKTGDIEEEKEGIHYRITNQGLKTLNSSCYKRFLTRPND
jgi:predicted transcriptional regulator